MLCALDGSNLKVLMLCTYVRSQIYLFHFILYPYFILTQSKNLHSKIYLFHFYIVSSFILFLHKKYPQHISREFGKEVLTMFLKIGKNNCEDL